MWHTICAWCHRWEPAPLVVPFSSDSGVPSFLFEDKQLVTGLMGVSRLPSPYYCSKSIQHDNGDPFPFPSSFQSFNFAQRLMFSATTGFPAFSPLPGPDLLEDCSLVQPEPQRSSYPLLGSLIWELIDHVFMTAKGEVLPLMNARTHQIHILTAYLALQGSIRH